MRVSLSRQRLADAARGSQRRPGAESGRQVNMTHAALDLPLQCRCGHVHGAALGVAPSVGFRFVCYCKDCQAFARLLKRPDVLDSAGGTDIFQLPPRRVTLTAGKDAVRCLCFSRRVLRWYADCCRTPIANTAAGPRFPVVGLIHSFIHGGTGGRPGDGLLGPPLCRIFERSALAPLPADAPPPPSVRLFVQRGANLLGWWWRGLGRPTPFFDGDTGEPLSAPHVVTPAEHAVL
jgi:Family of unknown function (DUF6151)